MPKTIHLNGFMLFSPAPHTQLSWVYPREKIRHAWHTVQYWEEIARTLERGCSDMFFFADGWGDGGEIGIQDEVAGLSESARADVLELLKRCEMADILDVRLTRGIGRAKNLEVWL